MPTATLAPTDMASWPPGARHYLTDDGQSLAVLVQSDLNDAAKSYVNQVLEALGDEPIESFVIPVRHHRIVAQPTVVIACNQDGTAIYMTPLWSFPPSTSYRDALMQAGFDVPQEN